MRALVVFLGLAAACDGLGQDYYTEEGECEAPAGSTALGGTPATVFDPGCLIDAFVDLRIVESEAEWQALFNCPQPVPQGIDLVADRAAVITLMCQPTNFRFAAETPGEVVVGVKTGISGACLTHVVVVPLPRAAKPVRLAQCRDVCHGECPPVP